MPRLSKLVGLALAMLCATDGVKASAWIEWPMDVCLTVFDLVAVPGESATVTARLQHDGMLSIRPSMAEYELHFRCVSFGDLHAITAVDGIATVETRVPIAALNPCSVDVRFAGSPHHKQAVSSGRLFLWPKDSRILITDVDHTISDLSLLQVPFTPNERIPALPGAAAALQELSRSYRIVYLSARDLSLYDKTRDWLRDKGFPEGPLFCREFQIKTSQEAFKRQFIAEFKKRYPQTVIGVGDQPGDGRAYLDNDMQALIIDPKGKAELPAGAVRVSSWQEIEQLLGERRGVSPP